MTESQGVCLFFAFVFTFVSGAMMVNGDENHGVVGAGVFFALLALMGAFA